MAIQQHLDPYPRLNPSNFKDLAGKSVLVTGGGYGIGAAIAKSFAEAGVAEIILTGRTESKLKTTADDLASFKKTKVSYYKTDISSMDDVKKLFNTLKAPVDFLVNNAGFLASPANFIEADLEEYWESFTINVRGTIFVTQAFFRHRESFKVPTPAVVITVNTMGAYSVPVARVPNLSSYCASKAALARWSECISVDIPEDKARFISIHPGVVKTAMAVKSEFPPDAFPATDAKLTGNFIAWAASEEASFLSGRFVWVNWDVDDLIAAKEEIIKKDLYKISLVDFA